MTRSGFGGAVIPALLLLAAVACAQQEEKPGPAPAPTNASAKRFTSWKILGPGGGGAQYRPTISPHDPNFALVATDMTSGFVTEDGGETWRLFNLRAVPQFFVFDPLDSNVIYVGMAGAGSMRSADRGRTWSQFYPSPLTRIGLADDEAEVYAVTANGYLEPIAAMVIDPTDSNVIYASMGSELRKTTDRGKTWATLVKMKGGLNRLFLDTNSPKGNRSLYGTGGDWVGAWEGGTFREVPQPGGTSWIYDASAGTPKDGSPLALYLIVDESTDRNKGPVIVSDDGGRTWRAAYLGLLDLRPPNTPFPYFASIGVCATNPDIAYVSYSRLALLDAPAGVLHMGVAKTTDRGKTWSVVWRDTSNQSGPNVDEPWLAERFGNDWPDNPHSIGVHPTNPDVVYTSDLGRTTRSVDGGVTWKGVYSKRVNAETWTTRGLDVLTGYGLHFDPFDNNRVFASFTDISLFRSEDRGSTWRDSFTGAPRAWRNSTYWVEFDPAVKGRMWAAMSAIHDLPRMKMIYRMRPNVQWNGGVAMSEDGGLTWKASAGMPPAACTYVLLDPTSPVDARVLWAVGFGVGVYKSVDGGTSWTLKNQGLAPAPGNQPTTWTMHRDARGALYLIVARRSEDGKVGTENDGAVYRSTDGADNWVRLKLPEGVTGPTGINTDPRDPNRLYMTAHGRSQRYIWDPLQPAGLFISTDAGANWKLVFDQDQYLYDISYDKRNPDLMYMSGYSSSAWRSTDKGQHWARIAGFNFKLGQRVFPDPQDPDMIYITTYGSSLWYGPAKGDGQSSDEDIVPPGVPYGGLKAVAEGKSNVKPQESAKTKKKKGQDEVAQR